MFRIKYTEKGALIYISHSKLAIHNDHFFQNSRKCGFNSKNQTF